MRFHKRIQKIGQAGDTIVEVLIVTAVLGLVLAGSYAIASRSLKGMQQAQERGEALKLAEGQLESVKTAVAANAPGVLESSQNLFCLESQGNTTPKVHKFTGAQTIEEPIEDDNFLRYPNACKRGLYHIAIEQNLFEGRGNYVVYVRWDGLNGTKQEVVLRYRLVEESD